MRRDSKAFTLVELMVAMAIIAVLIGLSVFGISTAQRVLRDNQRRDAVKNIAAGLNAHYATFAEYPSNINATETQIEITSNNIIPLNGIQKRTTDASDVSSTRYCYELTDTGYKLGAQLEDGSWFNLGTTAAAVDPNANCDNTDDPL